MLGNLVDNAVGAAVAGVAPRWVEVGAFDDRDALVVTVADSGAGLDGRTEAGSADGNRAGTAGSADADGVPDEAGPVHGHGLGLPLSREIARRGGGDLWVIDRGGDDHGAVFAARLVGVVAAPGTAPHDRAETGRPQEEDR